MSWYGDPDALDSLARQLERDADDVRREARSLVDAAGHGRWRGDAAEAFRRSVDEDAADVSAAARGLDEAAGALRQHADEVRARLAQIRALEHAVIGWFDDQQHALADAVTDPLGTLRRVVADPPWSGWHWQPHSLPASGDKAWLEVGDFLRSRGFQL